MGINTLSSKKFVKNLIKIGVEFREKEEKVQLLGRMVSC